MEPAKQLKTCRLCATIGLNFRAIFNGENEKNEIGEKISKCLPILISSDDELPGHICPICLRSLNTSYKLLMTVIETDGKLRQQLSQSRVPKNQDCELVPDIASSGVVKNEPETHGFCEINFVDAGAFDSHMETLDQSPWVCNLCHNSFETSAQLLQHKYKTHYINIDNSGGENDSAVVEIKNEGILESQNNIEHHAPKRTTKERFSEGMDRDINEEILSVDCTNFNISIDKAATFEDDNCDKSPLNSTIPPVQSDKKFACDQCPRKFTRKRHLEDHRNTHSRREPYTCDICNKTFRTYAAHWVHQQDHKETTEYTCDHCQRKYKYKRFLKRHMLNHLPPEEWDFECEVCKFKFKRSTYLKQHMRVHSGNQPYKCDICGATYGRGCDMSRHKKRHLAEKTEKKYQKKLLRLREDKSQRIRELKLDNSSGDIPKKDPVVCGLCGMSFDDADAFSSHMESIHQSKWVCNLCESSFATSNELLEHKHKTHHDNVDNASEKYYQDPGVIEMKVERTSVSEDCEDSLAPNQDSNQENQDSATVEVKKERTSVCEEDPPVPLAAQPPETQRVEDQQNVNSPEGLYSCEICHKTFKSCNARSGHQRIHRRGSHHNYTCDYCQKNYTRRCSIVKHITAHMTTSEVLFECELCRAPFKGASQLRNHMRTHTEARKHQCDICNVRFRRKHHLVRHKYCHRKADFHKKQLRKMVKLQKNNQLNSVEKTHNSTGGIEKNQSLMCGFCEITFVDTSTFDSHMEMFHQSKWVCNLCQNSFKTSEELLQHKYKTHYDNIDDAGGEDYTDYVALDVEEEISESRPPDTEKSVPKETTSEKLPEKNEETIEETVGSVDCTICCFSIDKAFMSEHKKIHELVSVMCTSCRYTFSTAYDFIKHNREIHHRFRNTTIRFFCRECKRSLSTPEALQEHQKVCEPQIPCKYCDKIFNSSELLKQHLDSDHRDKIPHDEVVELQCPQCNQTFNDKKLFMNHTHEPGPWKLRKRRIINSAEELYACRNCDKKFKTCAARLSHERTHGLATQYSEHTCDYCQRKYRFKSFLERHIHSHMPRDIKNFQCHMCPRKFTRGLSLRNHLRLHSNEDAYDCDICDARYRRRHDMLLHRNFHGAVKNSNRKRQKLSRSCTDKNQEDDYVDIEKSQPLCEISFVDTGAFAGPIETFQQSKWVCSICKDSFSTSDELQQHKEKKHYENIDNIGVEDRNDSGVIDIKEEIISVAEEIHTVSPDTKKVMKKINSEKIVHKNRRRLSSTNCLSCNASIDEAFMSEHKKMHEPFEVYCSICQSQFPTTYDLVRHKRVTHNMYNKTVIRFFCRDCNRGFTNSKALKAHTNYCKSRNKCKYCDKAFNWPEMLQLHLQKDHANKIGEDKGMDRLKCPQCNEVFTNKQLFMNHSHESGIRVEKKYKCEQCNEFFSTSTSLKAHCQDVHVKPSKMFLSTLSSRFNLRAQEKPHLNHKCPKCEETFEDIPELNAHLKQAHDVALVKNVIKKSFTCSYCPLKFRQRYRWEQHQNIHTGKHRYTCPTCDRKFNFKRSLSRHMHVHLPRENWEFECDLCKLKFKSREHLKKHIGIHSRDHAYKCDICGAAYLRECNLIRHKLCHSAPETNEEERQQLSPTPDEFQQNSESRTEHSSGEFKIGEPVICGFCEITFANVNAFDSHMERLHQSKWVCNLCQNSFVTSDELLQHKYKIHYDNIDNVPEKSHNSADIEKEATVLVSKPSDPEKSKKNIPNRQKKRNASLPQTEWICDQCQKSFSASDQLLQHIVEVHCSNIDDEVEDCPDSKAIEIKEEIILVSEHSDAESVAEETRKEIPTSKEIEEEIEAEAAIVDCRICNVPIERAFMPEHQKMHEPFELFCTKCHCKFPTAYDLINHKRETHNFFNGTIIRFYCRNCNRTLADSAFLRAHQKCVRVVHTCKYCNESFNWLQQLRLHLHQAHHDRMLKDKEVKIFECNQCGKVYTDRRRFRLHTSVHRARDKGRYKCKQCNVYYSKVKDLEDHRKTVHKRMRS